MNCHKNVNIVFRSVYNLLLFDFIISIFFFFFIKCYFFFLFFFFQAEDGIRDATVTGVQTCALPISGTPEHSKAIRGPCGSTESVREIGSSVVGSNVSSHPSSSPRSRRSWRGSAPTTRQPSATSPATENRPPG